MSVLKECLICSTLFIVLTAFLNKKAPQVLLEGNQFVSGFNPNISFTDIPTAGYEVFPARINRWKEEFGSQKRV